MSPGYFQGTMIHRDGSRHAALGDDHEADRGIEGHGGQEWERYFTKSQLLGRRLRIFERIANAALEIAG